MHPKFASILCCPDTGGSLDLHVEETCANGTVETGYLRNLSTGRVYPIVRGVPRFVSEELYADSFGFEWLKWSRVQFEDENAGGPMEGHTTGMFHERTQFAREDLTGSSAVEFGCGPGRFLDVVRRCGGIAVGIDMSVAVEAARENFRGDADVLIVQGDILKPPFKPATFDFGYTIGVLHHTPDPEGGLRRLVEVVKPGGQLACSVYPRGSFYASPSVRRFRAIHARLRALFGTTAARRAAVAYAQFAAYVLHPALTYLRRVPRVGSRLARHIAREWLVAVHLPDVRWRVLDVFDAITPAYASTHTPDEVLQWFEGAGCEEVRRTRAKGVSFAAKRSSASIAAGK